MQWFKSNPNQPSLSNMKTDKQNQRSLLRVQAALLLPLALLLTGSQSSLADTTTSAWSGATSTDWSTPGNWASGAPSATISALFNSSFANQPTLTLGQSCQGIWLNTGAGQDVTINSASPLILSNKRGN